MKHNCAPHPNIFIIYLKKLSNYFYSSMITFIGNFKIFFLGLCSLFCIGIFTFFKAEVIEKFSR